MRGGGRREGFAAGGGGGLRIEKWVIWLPAKPLRMNESMGGGVNMGREKVKEEEKLSRRSTIMKGDGAVDGGVNKEEEEDQGVDEGWVHMSGGCL